MESQAPPPVPQEMGVAARLVAVFFSPAEAFADIVRKPRWWVPLIIVAILGVVTVAVFSQHIGWESMLRQQMQRAARTRDLTSAQIEQAISVQMRFVPIAGYVAAVVGGAIYTFLTGAILMFLTNSMAGTSLKLKTMMGIVSHAYLPNMINGAVAIVLMFLKDPEDFDLQNPTMFNASIVLAADAARWMTVLLSSFDLFTFWTIFLIAVGIRAAAPKVKMGKAIAMVGMPWILWVAIKTLATAATS